MNIENVNAEIRRWKNIHSRAWMDGNKTLEMQSAKVLRFWRKEASRMLTEAGNKLNATYRMKGLKEYIEKK